MSQSNTPVPPVVAAEGTAFNAPGSDRVPGPADGRTTGTTTSLISEEDELDFLEQLSRLNSDFEDSLDVVRELESQCQDNGDLSPTFLALVRCALFRSSVRVFEYARNHPIATTLGVSAVGSLLGIALARRTSEFRVATRG